MKIRKGQPYRASELNLDDEAGVLWGVFVGGCIDERTAWTVWEGTEAHAHSGSRARKGLQRDPWFGWICILEPKHVLTPSGRPTKTLLHEYAHLLVPNVGHTVRWKQEVTRLGAGTEIARCRLHPL